MRSLQKIGITMKKYLESYHGRATYNGIYRHREVHARVTPSHHDMQVHDSHVLRSRGIFVWRQQCRSYYSTADPHVRLLKEECQPPSAHGRANLKRDRHGLPPCELASQLAKRLGTRSPGHALAPSRA